MKHLFTIAAVVASLAGTALAGPVDGKTFKKTVEMRPIYGTGWYGGVQMGINAYQNYDDPNLNAFGLQAKAGHSVGGFGGGKVGYVFGTGKIRPVLEADLFYNGFGTNVEVTNPGGPVAAFGGSLNSFAYLANFIVKFDLGRFQPYVGGGIGGYWADASIDSIPFPIAGLSGSTDTASWAWQVLAGADYYFTEKVSVFAEYKYLTYMDLQYFGGFAGVPAQSTDLGQSLVAVGVRVHF